MCVNTDAHCFRMNLTFICNGNLQLLKLLHNVGWCNGIVSSVESEFRAVNECVDLVCITTWVIRLVAMKLKTNHVRAKNMKGSTILWH